MSSKQKTAIAALICASIVAVSAMFAPNVKCEPDQQLIEDALGGDSSTSAPAAPKPDLGDDSSSSDGGSST